MCAVTFPAYGGKKMANERLRELRTLMKVRNVDAYYVPSSDFHDSEYVEDYFKCRAFLSGFTGSAGTMVITQAFSGMWTDGRYFVQAKKELEGQDTRLMAMGEEGVPTIEEYLMDHMPEGGVLGFDGRVVNAAQGRKFETMMAEKHATLSVGDDLAGEVWEERPILPAPEVWVLDVKYAGETVAEKLARLRAAMKKEHATVHILSSLDDVAWLFNIRKNSDDGNVLAPAFTLITEDEARLFINSRKFSPELRAYFEENHVAIEKYDAIYDAVAGIRNETVLLEPGKVNFALYNKNRCLQPHCGGYEPDFLDEGSEEPGGDGKPSQSSFKGRRGVDEIPVLDEEERGKSGTHRDRGSRAPGGLPQGPGRLPRTELHDDLRIRLQRGDVPLPCDKGAGEPGGNRWLLSGRLWRTVL